MMVKFLLPISIRVYLGKGYCGAFGHGDEIDKTTPELLTGAGTNNKVCLLGCGVATGIGSVCNVTDVGPQSTVAIFGLGTIGLAAVQGAKINGASRIIAVDINPDKFEKAKVVGATDCINPKDHVKPIDEVIRGMTNGGVDYSFECAGNVDVLHQAFASTNELLGLTVLVGLDPSPRKISLTPLDLLYGRRIVGAILGRYKGKTQLPELVEKYMNKEINLDTFITHEKPLADINTAFDLLLAGKSLRCVMQMF
ncbi:hypothetical protein SUGI_0808350 [Cryptomeria japonica]|nr:hypothetical protein SUGI_0808350 [Cryptomeria japonica]